MGLNLCFIGTELIYNQPFQEYIFRKLQKHCEYIQNCVFFKDGDKELFLAVERMLSTQKKIVFITTKKSFKTISKILSTINEDSLVIKEEMLVPSSVKIWKKNTYLLETKEATVNVIQVETNKKLPTILLEEKTPLVVQIFEENIDTLQTLLHPLTQTYEVKIEYVQLIPGWIELYVFSKRYGNKENFLKALLQLLKEKAIVTDNIMQHIIKTLSKTQQKITFAESCTGGLFSYYLTRNNGASAILDGSLITYANHIKESWLAVSQESLIQYGAVSSAVVEEMSEGALGVSEADFAISVSGIAGDSGGSEEKPVGTVFLNVRSKEKNTTLHLQLQGDRNYIQYQSVLYGIKTLLVENRSLFF